MTADAAAALRHRLGVDVPVLGAPMARVAGGALARAVTEAGGLGFVGGGYGDTAWIDAQLVGVDPGEVGVGLITWRLAEQPGALDHVLAHRPRAVWLSYGDPSPYVPAVHAAGSVAVCQVLSVDEAVAAAAAGADVLVAQGSEAGGHGRQGRGLLALLPAVVAAAGEVPVVAAGGIATGRQVAACMVLGAAGVALGTRLYATPEALDTPAAKDRLVALRGDETVHTTVFDRLRGPDWPEGYTGRAAANAVTRRWHGRDRELDAALDGERDRYRAAAAAGDMETRVLWAGEGVDHIDAVLPAGEVVRTLHDEARGWLAGGR